SSLVNDGDRQQNISGCSIDRIVLSPTVHREGLEPRRGVTLSERREHGREKEGERFVVLRRRNVIVTKKVVGEVEYNDAEFAEVRTIGIEGIENGLWLGTMQI